MPERKLATPSEPGELSVTVGDSESIDLDVDAGETIVFEWCCEDRYPSDSYE